MTALKDQILIVDQAIRQGQQREGQRLLRQLVVEVKARTLNASARADRVELASLARRLGLSPLGLTLLHPLVRPSARRPLETTAAEKAEYAANLIRLGVLAEAHALLDEVDVVQVPRAALFRAFAHMAQWDHSAANQALDEFLLHIDPNSYESLIAQVNLAVGHVFLKNHREAQTVVTALIEKTESTRSYLLLANALELAAQIAIDREEWSQAEKYLTKAQGLLSSPETFDAFLIEKKFAVLDAARVRYSPAALRRFDQLKKKAFSLRFWESARDCDFQKALASGDATLFRTLYFGTPYPSYRASIRSLCGSLDLDKPYTQKLGSGRPITQLNVFTGEGLLPQESLKTDQLLHRLFKTLSSDFYRPKRLYEIFESLYPDEYFHPVHSAEKIHQACRRLRRHFEQTEIALLLHENAGFYQWRPQPGRAIHLVHALTAPTQTPQNIRGAADELQRRLKEKNFSCTEAATTLKISPRSALTLLKNLLQHGLVLKIGGGRSTVYHFKK